MNIAIPYDAIPSGTGDIWEEGTPEMQVEVKSFGGNTNAFDGLAIAGGVAQDGKDFKVYINGSDKTSEVNYGQNLLRFTTNGFTKTNATYSYDVKLVYKNGDNTYIEEMSFKISYTNTTKPVYDLKFGQPDTDGIVLKDGVYFVDSATNAVSTLTEGVINVLKNDGSKFTEVAYYAQNSDAYPTANLDKKVNDSQITMSLGKAQANVNGTQTYYVTVETKYAFYQGKITFKYRTNVTRIDPKGVFFAKDEYTIGVNEVLTPTFTTTVPCGTTWLASLS